VGPQKEVDETELEDEVEETDDESRFWRPWIVIVQIYMVFQMYLKGFRVIFIGVKPFLD
jgi:hypothetical protein